MKTLVRQSTLENEDELIERVQRHREKASFEPLVERYKQPVMKLLYRMTGDYDGSLELAQETFLRAWKYIGSYQPGMRFSSWLFKIAANLANEHNSARRKHLEREEPLDETTAKEPRTEGFEQALEGGIYVQSLLDKVREPYKTAVILRFMEDMSYGEIAAVMETTIENVKNYLFRGRKYMLELAKEATNGK